MSDGRGNEDGVLASVRRVADSLLRLAQNRIQVFALELRGETLRGLDLLLQFSAALVVGAVGLVVGTAALTIFLWKTVGYAGLVVVSGTLLGLSALWVGRVRDGIRKAPMPFAETAAEFEKDRTCLQQRR